jgi:FdhD protein
MRLTMLEPTDAIRRLPVVRFDGVSSRLDDDHLAVEAPVALVFNGISYAVMMATPQDLEDLALGFALSEGLIHSRAECRDANVRHQAQGFEVELEIASSAFAALKQRKRSMEGRTGCGLCGLESLQQLDLQTLPRRSPAAALVPPAMIQRAFAALPERQLLNAQTGACHAAAWVREDGQMAQVREDVGRHNALDKLLGARAWAGESSASGFVIISSRASVELVRKCAHLGVGALAAISAPTSLAVEVARQAGIQLYGFCRRDQVVHYTS